MKLKVGGRLVDARLEYVPDDERLVLRTELAFLSPEDTRQMKVELAELTVPDRDLLFSSGYAWLVRGGEGGGT